MGLRADLDRGDPGHRAHHDFLHSHQRDRRETVSPALPGRPVLVSGLPHPENSGRVYSTHVHRLHQLLHAAALHPQAEHEKQQPQAEVPGHQVHHDRHVVLLLLLDAEPRRHSVERPGQTELCQLGQRVLHRPHLCVPDHRVPGSHQQLPEPDHLLPHEEGV